MADPPGPLPAEADFPGLPCGLPTRRMPPRWLLLAAVCCLGASAIITQLVLLRELLCLLAGNEIVLGILLGNWFLLTGLGTLLGRRTGRSADAIGELVLAHLLVAVLPAGSVLALRTLRNVVLVRGMEVGIVQSVVASGLLLAPYCLIAGYVLTLACRLLASGRPAESIGKVYALDVLGDIGGGALFSFVLVHLLGHFGILYVPAGMNLAAGVAVAVAGGRRGLAVAAGLVAAGAVAVAVAGDLDGASVAREYAGANVVYQGNSPYGRLVVTASDGRHVFYENGCPLWSTQDVERAEEAAHYAMAQRPGARDVLLISAGVSGTAREVLKWPVRRVDYVERDPRVVELARRFAPGLLGDARLVVHGTDGRVFVRRSDRRFDVAILDVGDPGTFQVNRFYTVDFLRQLRRVLRDGGVVAVSLGGYENYLDEHLARRIAVLHRTLKAVFANVLMLPGGRVFFLAGDGELTTDVAGALTRAGVASRYVRAEVLDATLTPDRLAELRRAVRDDAPVNRDAAPVLTYHQVRYWLGKHPGPRGLLVGLAFVALAAYAIRLRAVTAAIFTTGLAGSALQVVVLVGFQIVHGTVYDKVGLIVTAFMAGLAGGAFLANRLLGRWGRRDLAKIEFALAACAALVPVALVALGRLAEAGAETLSSGVAFPLLAGALGVLVGMAFPVAARADFRGAARTASRLYTADYVGACVGALLVGALLIPLVGIAGVCWIVAGLSVASGLWVRFS